MKSHPLCQTLFLAITLFTTSHALSANTHSHTNAAPSPQFTLPLTTVYNGEINSLDLHTLAIVKAAQGLINDFPLAQQSILVQDINALEPPLSHNSGTLQQAQGISLGEMSSTQQNATQTLLSLSLNRKANEMPVQVLIVQNQLAEHYHHWDNFRVSVMGTPSADTPWSWQIESAEFALHFFILGNHVAMTTSTT